MVDEPVPAKPCWSCASIVDAVWLYCPMCAARLKETRIPSAPNPLIDYGFLQDIYSFGWFNHDVVALALYDSVAGVMAYYDPKRPKAALPLVEANRSQHILRAKLFAEFIALLEAFGMLCVALQKRKTQSILWTYLNIEPREVTSFYAQVVATPKLDVIKLLNFPRWSVFERAANSSTLDLPSVRSLQTSYQQLGEAIRRVAEMYRDNSGANVRIYNKIKHGFPIIEGGAWIEPAIDPERVAILITHEGVLGRLEMSQERADQEMKNIRTVTEMGEELLRFTIALQQLGILMT